jgi:hypothetical protein
MFFSLCYRQLIIIKMETKKCSRCGEILTLDKFHKDSRYEKGVKGQCRKCLQDLRSKRYYDNPEKYKKKMNEWIKSTPELTEKRLITAYTKYLQDRGFSVVAP